MGFKPPADTSRYLLIADETAHPAVAVVIEAIGDATPTTALVETQRDATLAPLPSRRRTQVQVVQRKDDPPGTSTAMLEAVQRLSIGTDGVFVFGATETRQAATRRYLRRECGVPATRMHLTGYWRRRTAA